MIHAAARTLALPTFQSRLTAFFDRWRALGSNGAVCHKPVHISFAGAQTLVDSTFGIHAAKTATRNL